MWELDYKKAERRRIDAFELWCWRRLLRVPWTARRSNQSTLKKFSPGFSLEGIMLKLKLQFFGPPDSKSWHLKRPWCWERLRAEGEGDDRGWDCWMASSTQWTWVWVSFGRWSTSVLQSTELQIVWHNWVIEQQCSISLTKFKNKPWKEKLNKCYGLNVFSLKIHMLKSNPRCDGM